MVLAGSTGAQRDAPRPSDGSAVIRGRVVAADTLAPLRDVTVGLHQADKVPTIRPGTPINNRSTGLTGLPVRPDANGQFELVGVPPGRYRLAVDPGPASGRYLAARYPDPAAEESQPLTVTAGQVLERIVVTLPRAAVISGRVVDESGNPLSHVSITAQELLAGERRRMAASVGSTSRTDDTGSFRVFGLRPGEYVLSAIVLPQFAMPVGTAPMPGSQPPTYYPGTGSLAEAARIRLAAGDEHGPVSFVFSQVRLSTIRGTVIDANGQPASTVSVNIRTTETQGTGPMTIGGRTTSSDGTFEVSRVPPGQFTLSVSHYGPAGAQFGSSPLTVTDDVEGIVIRLQPGTTLNGQVVFDGEPPVPLPTMYVAALPSRAGGADSSRVMPAADLSFKLENLFGPMFVRADLPGWHLKAVLLGGRDVTDQAMEFVSGGPALQVVMSKRMGSLSGIVRTAAGVTAESLVVLLNQDPAAWHDGVASAKTAMTSSDGKYRIEGIRGGRYLAVATLRDDAIITGTSGAHFEMLAKHAIPVTIDDGESKTLDLKRVMVQ
jgi:hypothetical protein